MGVRERDCRASQTFVIEPAAEGVASSSCGKAGWNLLPGSNSGGGDGRAGVGIEAHVQGIGIPLRKECEVSSFAVGVRERDGRA